MIINREKIFLPTLESIRGIAAVLVMIAHFWFWAFDTPLGSRFSRCASLGVDLFFVLSGYILSRNYLVIGERVATATYLKHRFARIYPLHLFFLAAFSLAYLVIGKSMDEISWLSEITLTTAIYSDYILNSVSWSLSAEWLSYIAFAVLLPMTLRQRRVVIVSTIIVAGALCLAFSGGNITILSHKWGFIRGLFGFFLGCLSWEIENLGPPHRFVLWAALALQVAYVIIDYGQEHLKIFIVLTFVPLVTHLAQPRSQTGWLTWKPIVWVGTVSFSLYMGHVFWGEVVEAGLSKLGGAPPHYMEFAKISAAFAGAVVTYYLIERPARSFLRRKL